MRPHSWGRMLRSRPNVSARVRTRHAERARHVTAKRRPLEVEYAEEKGWDLDYYMTSLYYMVRPRAEFEKLLGGHAPLGEIYLPSDPPRMMETIGKARRPCLAYKVLAAGRTVDSPQQVKERMAAALNGIKPTDAVIIGMYQRFNDQIGQTAQFVREILAG